MLANLWTIHYPLTFELRSSVLVSLSEAFLLVAGSDTRMRTTRGDAGTHESSWGNWKNRKESVMVNQLNASFEAIDDENERATMRTLAVART